MDERAPPRTGEGPRRRAAAETVHLRSPRLVAAFDRIFARTFRRHMRALRLARWGRPEAPAGAPLIVLAAHPSWWDGVLVLLLARRLFPDRAVFVPMAASALARYPFVRRLGVFGIDTEAGGRGAATLLLTATEVLAAPERMLWVHAHGRFADPRERPVPIAPALARLADLSPTAVVLPLAVEYVFWTERRAEALTGFGPPLAVAALCALGREERLARLGAALEATMDRLAADAVARDPARFEVLLRGGEGLGGVYGLWQRGRAALAGQRHDPRHDPRSEPRA